MKSWTVLPWILLAAVQTCVSSTSLSSDSTTHPSLEHTSLVEERTSLESGSLSSSSSILSGQTHTPSTKFASQISIGTVVSSFKSVSNIFTNIETSNQNVEPSLTMSNSGRESVVSSKTSDDIIQTSLTTTLSSVMQSESYLSEVILSSSGVQLESSPISILQSSTKLETDLSSAFHDSSKEILPSQFSDSFQSSTVSWTGPVSSLILPSSTVLRSENKDSGNLGSSTGTKLETSFSNYLITSANENVPPTSTILKVATSFNNILSSSSLSGQNIFDTTLPLFTDVKLITSFGTVLPSSNIKRLDSSSNSILRTSNSEQLQTSISNSGSSSGGVGFSVSFSDTIQASKTAELETSFNSNLPISPDENSRLLTGQVFRSTSTVQGNSESNMDIHLTSTTQLITSHASKSQIQEETNVSSFIEVVSTISLLTVSSPSRIDSISVITELNQSSEEKFSQTLMTSFSTAINTAVIKSTSSDIAKFITGSLSPSAFHSSRVKDTLSIAIPSSVTTLVNSVIETSGYSSTTIFDSKGGLHSTVSASDELSLASLPVTNYTITHTIEELSVFLSSTNIPLVTSTASITVATSENNTVSVSEPRIVSSATDTAAILSTLYITPTPVSKSLLLHSSGMSTGVHSNTDEESVHSEHTPILQTSSVQTSNVTIEASIDISSMTAISSSGFIAGDVSSGKSREKSMVLTSMFISKSTLISTAENHSPVFVLSSIRSDFSSQFSNMIDRYTTVSTLNLGPLGTSEINSFYLHSSLKTAVRSSLEYESLSAKTNLESSQSDIIKTSSLRNMQNSVLSSVNTMHLTLPLNVTVTVSSSDSVDLPIVLTSVSTPSFSVNVMSVTHPIETEMVITHLSSTDTPLSSNITQSSEYFVTLNSLIDISDSVKTDTVHGEKTREMTQLVTSTDTSIKIEHSVPSTIKFSNTVLSLSENSGIHFIESTSSMYKSLQPTSQFVSLKTETFDQLDGTKTMNLETFTQTVIYTSSEDVTGSSLRMFSPADTLSTQYLESGSLPIDTHTLVSRTDYLMKSTSSRILKTSDTYKLTMSDTEITTETSLVSLPAEKNSLIHSDFASTKGIKTSAIIFTTKLTPTVQFSSTYESTILISTVQTSVHGVKSNSGFALHSSDISASFITGSNTDPNLSIAPTSLSFEIGLSSANTIEAIDTSFGTSVIQINSKYVTETSLTTSSGHSFVTTYDAASSYFNPSKFDISQSLQSSEYSNIIISTRSISYDLKSKSSSLYTNIHPTKSSELHTSPNSITISSTFIQGDSSYVQMSESSLSKTVSSSTSTPISVLTQITSTLSISNLIGSQTSEQTNDIYRTKSSTPFESSRYLTISNTYVMEATASLSLADHTSSVVAPSSIITSAVGSKRYSEDQLKTTVSLYDSGSATFLTSEIDTMSSKYYEYSNSLKVSTTIIQESNSILGTNGLTSSEISSSQTVDSIGSSNVFLSTTDTVFGSETDLFITSHIDTSFTGIYPTTSSKPFESSSPETVSSAYIQESTMSLSLSDRISSDVAPSSTISSAIDSKRYSEDQLKTIKSLYDSASSSFLTSEIGISFSSLHFSPSLSNDFGNQTTEIYHTKSSKHYESSHSLNMSSNFLQESNSILGTNYLTSSEISSSQAVDIIGSSKVYSSTTYSVFESDTALAVASKNETSFNPVTKMSSSSSYFRSKNSGLYTDVYPTISSEHSDNSSAFIISSTPMYEGTSSLQISASSLSISKTVPIFIMSTPISVLTRITSSLSLSKLVGSRTSEQNTDITTMKSSTPFELSSSLTIFSTYVQQSAVSLSLSDRVSSDVAPSSIISSAVDSKRYSEDQLKTTKSLYDSASASFLTSEIGISISSLTSPSLSNDFGNQTTEIYPTKSSKHYESSNSLNMSSNFLQESNSILGTNYLTSSELSSSQAVDSIGSSKVYSSTTYSVFDSNTALVEASKNETPFNPVTKMSSSSNYSRSKTSGLYTDVYQTISSEHSDISSAFKISSTPMYEGTSSLQMSASSLSISKTVPIFIMSTSISVLTRITSSLSLSKLVGSRTSEQNTDITTMKSSTPFEFSSSLTMFSTYVQDSAVSLSLSDRVSSDVAPSSIISSAVDSKRYSEDQLKTTKSLYDSASASFLTSEIGISISSLTSPSLSNDFGNQTTEIYPTKSSKHYESSNSLNMSSNFLQESNSILGTNYLTSSELSSSQVVDSIGSSNVYSSTTYSVFDSNTALVEASKNETTFNPVTKMSSSSNYSRSKTSGLYTDVYQTISSEHSDISSAFKISSTPMYEGTSSLQMSASSLSISKTVPIFIMSTSISVLTRITSSLSLSQLVGSRTSEQNTDITTMKSSTPFEFSSSLTMFSTYVQDSAVSLSFSDRVSSDVAPSSIISSAFDSKRYSEDQLKTTKSLYDSASSSFLTSEIGISFSSLTSPSSSNDFGNPTTEIYPTKSSKHYESSNSLNMSSNFLQESNSILGTIDLTSSGISSSRVVDSIGSSKVYISTAGSVFDSDTTLLITSKSETSFNVVTKMSSSSNYFRSQNSGLYTDVYPTKSSVHSDNSRAFIVSSTHMHEGPSSLQMSESSLSKHVPNVIMSTSIIGLTRIASSLSLSQLVRSQTSEKNTDIFSPKSSTLFESSSPETMSSTYVQEVTVSLSLSERISSDVAPSLIFSSVVDSERFSEHQLKTTQSLYDSLTASFLTSEIDTSFSSLTSPSLSNDFGNQTTEIYLTTSSNYYESSNTPFEFSNSLTILSTFVQESTVSLSLSDRISSYVAPSSIISSTVDSKRYSKDQLKTTKSLYDSASASFLTSEIGISFSSLTSSPSLSNASGNQTTEIYPTKSSKHYESSNSLKMSSNVIQESNSILGTIDLTSSEISSSQVVDSIGSTKVYLSTTDLVFDSDTVLLITSRMETSKDVVTKMTSSSNYFPSQHSDPFTGVYPTKSSEYNDASSVLIVSSTHTYEGTTSVQMSERTSNTVFQSVMISSPLDSLSTMRLKSSSSTDLSYDSKSRVFLTSEIETSIYGFTEITSHPSLQSEQILPSFTYFSSEIFRTSTNTVSSLVNIDTSANLSTARKVSITDLSMIFGTTVESKMTPFPSSSRSSQNLLVQSSSVHTASTNPISVTLTGFQSTTAEPTTASFSSLQSTSLHSAIVVSSKSLQPSEFEISASLSSYTMSLLSSTTLSIPPSVTVIPSDISSTLFNKTEITSVHINSSENITFTSVFISPSSVLTTGRSFDSSRIFTSFSVESVASIDKVTTSMFNGSETVTPPIFISSLFESASTSIDSFSGIFSNTVSYPHLSSNVLVSVSPYTITIVSTTMPNMFKTTELEFTAVSTSSILWHSSISHLLVTTTPSLRNQSTPLKEVSTLLTTPSTSTSLSYTSSSKYVYISSLTTSTVNESVTGITSTDVKLESSFISLTTPMSIFAKSTEMTNTVDDTNVISPTISVTTSLETRLTGSSGLTSATSSYLHLTSQTFETGTVSVSTSFNVSTQNYFTSVSETFSNIPQITSSSHTSVVSATMSESSMSIPVVPTLIESSVNFSTLNVESEILTSTQVSQESSWTPSTPNTFNTMSTSEQIHSSTISHQTVVLTTMSTMETDMFTNTVESSKFVTETPLLIESSLPSTASSLSLQSSLSLPKTSQTTESRTIVPSSVSTVASQVSVDSSMSMTDTPHVAKSTISTESLKSLLSLTETSLTFSSSSYVQVSVLSSSEELTVTPTPVSRPASSFSTSSITGGILFSTDVSVSSTLSIPSSIITSSTNVSGVEISTVSISPSLSSVSTTLEILNISSSAIYNSGSSVVMTSSILTTTVKPPSTTTQNATNAKEAKWVRTVLKIQRSKNVSNPSFVSEMEKSLANAYNEAFIRGKLIHEGNFEPLQRRRRRKRFTTVGDVSVHIHEVSRVDDTTTVSAAYAVERSGELLSAEDAAAALDVLDTQELAIILRQVVDVKAEPYIQTETPYEREDAGSDLWLIGIIVGAIAGAIIVIWIIACIYCKCCRQTDDEEDTEPELTSIHPQPSKRKFSDGRPLPASPKKTFVSQGSKFSLKKGRTYEINDAYVPEAEMDGQTLLKSPMKKKQTSPISSVTGSASVTPVLPKKELVPPAVTKGRRNSRNSIGPSPEDYGLNNGGLKLTSPKSNRSHMFQSSVSEDSEDTKRQLKRDRKKNKERMNELYAQEFVTAPQEEIRPPTESKILGMPNTSVPSFVIESGSPAKEPLPSSRRPSFQDGNASGDENIEEARSRMHKLLDDAFSLISPRSSFTENDLKAEKSTDKQKDYNPSTMSSTDVEKAKEALRGFANPAYANSYNGYLETWSPYRASDQVALISMPHKPEPAVTRLGSRPDKRPATSRAAVGRRPAAHLDQIGSKSISAINDTAKYTTSSPKPIVLRTKDDTPNGRTASARSDKIPNNLKNNRTISTSAFNGDALIYGSGTSIPKSGQHVRNETKDSIEMQSMGRNQSNSVKKHRVPERNSRNRDEVDVIQNIKPEEATDNLVKSLRVEIKSSKGETEEDINKKPIRRRNRKALSKPMTDIV